MRGVYSIRSKTENPRGRATISTQSGYLDTSRADERRHLLLAADTLDDHKAADVIVLDLRGLSDAADYFIIASGSSDRHVRALAEHVVDILERAGCRAHHVEGLTSARWALLDYVDFVVHIFHPTLRQFYQLERLWADAPSVSTSLQR